ncbi:hypothetical protein O1D97_02875 [Marinomonas sp. 15G1-11]|uniref:Addiction module component n=1 Tax=Marinomonas phaeophyticola TaxID=3004091 RepID=A0ABT4JQF1_9GAMM|nr:hypothetical protein [Marinomonas sp. 15G1-11]MCZ2720612.1 hypothetical protein [Marinomonas sp. 15G1-11]
MSDKIVLFPTLTLSKAMFDNKASQLEKDVQQYVSKDELANLREAFDVARKDWPIEAPELPEENKHYSFKR